MQLGTLGGGNHFVEFQADDDGRLFYYWGCTPTDGIFGVELDADNPTRMIGTPKKMISDAIRLCSVQVFAALNMTTLFS